MQAYLVAAALIAASPPAGQVSTRCDQLAAYGPDPQRVAVGRARDEIVLPDAITACETDAAADPSNPRLAYQLSRLYGYAGRDGDAERARSLALRAGYPIALTIEGIRLLEQLPPAICHAEALMRRGAEAGGFEPVIGYASRIFAGQFGTCTTVSRPRLRAMLAQARPQAAGHVEKLLVDSLIREAGALSGTATEHVRADDP